MKCLPNVETKKKRIYFRKSLYTKRSKDHNNARYKCLLRILGHPLQNTIRWGSIL